jgi:hypothetical protein
MIMKNLSLFSTSSVFLLAMLLVFPNVSKADTNSIYGNAAVVHISCYSAFPGDTAYPGFTIDTRGRSDAYVVLVEGVYFYDTGFRPYTEFSSPTTYFTSDHSITAQGINRFSAVLLAQGFLPNGEPVVLYQEAQQGANQVVCDNRPLPVVDSGGGDGSGDGGGGGTPPFCNQPAYLCGASTMVDPHLVASKGTIGSERAPTVSRQNQNFKETVVAVGQWFGKSWQDQA